MSTEVVKKKPAATEAAIGKSIDKIFALRKKKSELEAAVKDVEGQIADLEGGVLEQMEAAGTKKVATKLGSATINESVVANVTDWDAFWVYIHKNKFGHLLQRRVSDPAYRELLEQGKKVPGVQPFNKKKLGFRAAS